MFWSGRQVAYQPFYGLAVDMLRRQIHLGMMRPNERLPPERQFAQELGMSRVTLREALKALEDAGYLVTRRGAAGGTFVVTDESLNAIAHRHVTINPARTWRCIEFLRANLTAAAALASERRSPSDLAEIERRVSGLRAAEGSADLREAQCHIFLAIGSASMNELFRESIDHAIEGLFHPIIRDQFQQRHLRFLDLFETLLESLARREHMRCGKIAGSLNDELAAVVQEGMAPQTA